jgi:hypothetical protein
LSKNHPRIKIKYVTVAWLTDSISAGKRLSEALFTPPGLQHGQRTLKFDTGQTHEHRQGIKVSKPDVIATEVDICSEPSGADGANSLVDKIPSASDPNYMKSFYGASRLHFIGTWRSRLPALIEELSQEKRLATTEGTGYQYELQRFPSTSNNENRTSSIIHIDMDCFFVSVLIRTKPHLWSMPVAVAHSSSAGSSEVSSCNYPAREFGIKAGMFMKQARALCPNLTVLRYDFTQYEIVSKQLYKLCLGFSPVVQPVSVDELYIECAAGHDVPTATQYLRDQIFHETGCTASAGISVKTCITIVV